MSGQQRVIIENIQPQVDGGLYPSKRTVGERVEVTADIFGDGHDHIRAEVRWKSSVSGPWQLLEMEPLGNDQWMAAFTVPSKGRYFFTIQAWVDHFETWYDGIRKKIGAGLHVSVELQEGSAMLMQVAAKNAAILEKATLLSQPASYDAAVALVQSPAFAALVKERPLRRHVTEAGKEFEVVVEQKKALYSTWYELFPRSASLTPGRHGTFQDVIKLLPRVAAMHFDVLYLPPIHPIGKKNRKGKNNSTTAQPGEPGSPWAIGSDEGGHKAVHPELGTLDDYRKLIAEARKHGIDVALDLAFQCAPDHPYVKEHPEWFKQRPDGSIQYAENPPKKYQDIYPFDFESEHWKPLWEELRSVVYFWIDNGVRIFRVDNPHTKPIPFWKWIIAETNRQYPDIIFLAEAFTRPRIMGSLAKVGFNQGYTYFTWRLGKQEIIDYMTELTKGSSRNYFRPNFWPNTPDILPWHLQYQQENIFIIRLALAATLSASYGIYGPAYEFCDNQPLDGKEEYHNSEKFEVKHYDWRKTNRMTDLITLLNKARQENEALQSTWNIHFCSIENPHLLAYLKMTDDKSSIILMIVNLDAHNRQAGYVEMSRSLLGVKEKMNLKLHDLMTEEEFTWTQEWNYVELEPNKLPFHLFKVEVHESLM